MNEVKADEELKEKLPLMSAQRSTKLSPTEKLQMQNWN
jgi:hypothetical protein